MLVLTRKSGECIRIGEDIKILVLDIKGDRIRIGIEAPAGVPVHREEIYQKIQIENVSASKVDDELLSEITRMWKMKETTK